MLFLSTKVKFVILPVVISAEFAWEENKRCLLVILIEPGPLYCTTPAGH